MYLTVDQAVNRTKRLNSNPEFTAENLKQLAEAGTLQICFHYRGTLGVFKFPAVTLPPMPERTIYFDGYLRSLANPRLHSATLMHGIRQVTDQLTPTAVEIASSAPHIHTIDIQPPEYWGRVRDEFRHVAGIQPAMMENSPIAESEWLIEEADLDKYIQMSAAPATAPPAGEVGAPVTTTASEPAQGNAPPAETVVAASDGPASPVKSLPAWLTKNIDYIAHVNREHKCSSAQDLFRKLMELATEDNATVQKGANHTRGKLYFVNTCSAIADNTFGKFLPEIRAHVLR